MIAGHGTRVQAGTPRASPNPTRKANGLLLRGVVVATYVTDEDKHPASGYDENHKPVAVYCDVLVLPSIPGQRFFGLQGVLVSQDVAGMHRGRIWKPRAASLDLVSDLNIQGGSDPALVDGDHVLVGFLNDSLSQPVILRSLPHPSTDLGREDRELGQRMKLTTADGDPDFFRHHGVHYGVDDLGNFEVDSTFGNDGSLDGQGKEPAPPTDGTKGNQTFILPMDAAFSVVLMDMADPSAPVVKSTLVFDQGKVNVKIDSGEAVTIQDKDGNATLTLGDGAVKAAIADHLETLWGQLKAWLEALTVPTGTGPSGTPANAPAPPWDPNINSQKLTIPDN